MVTGGASLAFSSSISGWTLAGTILSADGTIDAMSKGLMSDGNGNYSPIKLLMIKFGVDKDIATHAYNGANIFVGIMGINGAYSSLDELITANQGNLVDGQSYEFFLKMGDMIIGKTTFLYGVTNAIEEEVKILRKENKTEKKKTTNGENRK